jgi:hypothetical protein
MENSGLVHLPNLRQIVARDQGCFVRDQWKLPSGEDYSFHGLLGVTGVAPEPHCELKASSNPDRGRRDNNQLGCSPCHLIITEQNHRAHR